MHAFKLPSLCLLLFLLLSAEKCEKSNVNKEHTSTQKPADLVLLEATSMKWVAGIKEGGSGTEYTFTVVVGAKKPVAILDVSINGEKQEYAVIKQGEPVSNMPVHIEQHDTLHIRVSNELSIDTTQALINYSIGGKTHQLEVNEIEILETQNRP